MRLHYLGLSGHHEQARQLALEFSQFPGDPNQVTDLFTTGQQTVLIGVADARPIHDHHTIAATQLAAQLFEASLIVGRGVLDRPGQAGAFGALGAVGLQRVRQRGSQHVGGVDGVGSVDQ
ncbi:Uncharacterised protein [Mycobacterium tuberculosis]|uniref:Uncharacterized protein n=1 Tax=Mycobacterium tuberculosis TaxID=1773 RepID=A0A0T7LLR2_MYCTX|nr:Uncharacterised protein [Mycobacterium tuberculosis]CFE46312.1 Uncharacterised protein [Mycobacterium tuberculosis]CFS02056.1 Uncharacterised protein [Mycobacterium tuberculosis]CKP23050.1 Uncharacterised protein [Mycobacterium tuberculosis]CKQ85290.1 Uncharacterised protein [Mycobacterium tuberculosis]